MWYEEILKFQSQTDVDNKTKLFRKLLTIFVKFIRVKIARQIPVEERNNNSLVIPALLIRRSKLSNFSVNVYVETLGQQKIPCCL